MALIEQQLDRKINKVDLAIERLQSFSPEEGYWLAYSGGKDSVVIKRLAEMAGIKFQAHYSCTSVDPPELVRFVKNDKTVSFDIPHDKDGKPVTMWSLIANRKMPPIRQARYCCSELKESSGIGTITITGVRWAESDNRKNNQGTINIWGNRKKELTKKRAQALLEDFSINKSGGITMNLDNDTHKRMVEICYRTRKTLLNPIIDWSDSDVWEFIKTENIPYCELYGDIKKEYCDYFNDGEFKRLGCIGCPMAKPHERKFEFAKYPTYKDTYIKTFDKMLKNIDNPTDWKDGEEVFDWWLYGGKRIKVDKNQISMFKGEK